MAQGRRRGSRWGAKKLLSSRPTTHFAFIYFQTEVTVAVYKDIEPFRNIRKTNKKNLTVLFYLTWDLLAAVWLLALALANPHVEPGGSLESRTKRELFCEVITDP